MFELPEIYKNMPFQGLIPRSGFIAVTIIERWSQGFPYFPYFSYCGERSPYTTSWKFSRIPPPGKLPLVYSPTNFIPPLNDDFHVITLIFFIFILFVNSLSFLALYILSTHAALPTPFLKQMKKIYICIYIYKRKKNKKKGKQSPIHACIHPLKILNKLQSFER